jgi:hypothetical protein
MILQEISSKKKDMYFGVNAANQVQKFSLYKSKNSNRHVLRFRVCDYAPSGKFHNEWAGPLCTGTNKRQLLLLADQVISQSTDVERYKSLRKILEKIKNQRKSTK